MRKRLDVRLVELGLAPSRSKAQQMIAAGDVEERDGEIKINPNSLILKYVSRGGLKLESALCRLKLDVTGIAALDIGISTGGFSDCLLKAGAKSVIGIDVGHGQLDARLQGDARLTLHEGVNVRELDPNLGEGVDLCVVDVSFISLTLAIPALARALRPSTRLLALVKPQFEVGAGNLDKRGVVRDPRLFEEVKLKITGALVDGGFSIQDYFACGVTGQDGNQEFFAYAIR
jgi:23S rRNA (cytidine1920-2'-O)/16S rRNA (cytidine1409-2'-O)-methyltransferase